MITINIKVTEDGPSILVLASARSTNPTEKERAMADVIRESIVNKLKNEAGGTVEDLTDKVHAAEAAAAGDATTPCQCSVCQLERSLKEFLAAGGKAGLEQTPNPFTTDSSRQFSFPG